MGGGGGGGDGGGFQLSAHNLICVLCYFTSEVVIQMQRVGWGRGRGGGV